MKKLLLAVTLLFLAACKKSDDAAQTLVQTPVQTDQQKIDLLVDKKWQITEEYQRNASGMSADMWPSHPAYDKDDYTIWKSNLTFLASDGTLMAPNQTAHINDTGTWVLKNSIITMNFTAFADSENIKIMSITPTRMVMKIPINPLSSLLDSNIDALIYTMIPVQ